MRVNYSRKTAAFVRVRFSATSLPYLTVSSLQKVLDRVCNRSMFFLPSRSLLSFSLSFCQACAAYSFITIPSLTSIFSRLNLYLLSGQVALANQCFSQGELIGLSTRLNYIGSSPFGTPCLNPSVNQSLTRCFSHSRSHPFFFLFLCLSADAFLKAAVSVLPEVPRSISIEGKQRSSESFLLDFINNFLSTLLVVPVTQQGPSSHQLSDTSC